MKENISTIEKSAGDIKLDSRKAVMKFTQNQLKGIGKKELLEMKMSPLHMVQMERINLENRIEEYKNSKLEDDQFFVKLMRIELECLKKKELRLLEELLHK